MAKNKVSEWSSTAANNTDIASIDIAEGCAPSGINNAIRELMAQVKDMQSGTDADNFTVGGNLSVTGTTTATGAITANGGLTGNLTGNVTGNLTGNVTGNVTGSAGSLTSTLAVANGGTGLTTLTANNVILGNGTSAPSFVAPSTSGNVLTSNGTTWQSTALPNNSIGTGQTWQDVSGSRVAGTSYQNTTGKPIQVAVSGDGNGSVRYMQVSTDNSTWINVGVFNSVYDGSTQTIVPNNIYYRAGSGVTISVWAELR
jgi:hypothetical protein